MVERRGWWKGICIFGIALSLTLLLTSPAFAWWNTDWECRRPITIQSDNALTDYQILVQLNTSNFDFSKANPDGSDIRFVDEDDTTKLSYWIEEWNASSQTARIWVNVTSIPAGEKTIYLYYDNSNAVSESDGEAVFEFFDDFEGTSLDANKWGIDDGSGGGYHSVANSAVHLVHPDHTSGGWQGYYAIYSKDGYLFELPAIVETRIKPLQSTSTGHDDEETVRLERHDNQGISLLTSFTNHTSYRWMLKENQDRTAGYQASGGFASGTESYHNVWLTHKIVIDSSQTATVYFDDSEKGSTTIDWSGSTRIVFHVCRASSGDGDAELYVDWIRVRKYTSLEPSISVGAEELGLQPLLNISGYVFYANNTPCNNPTVNVTNLNNGMEWVAETNETNNYYHLVIYEGQANASEQLKFEVSSPDEKQTNTTYYTITDEDISAGNLTLNFTLTGDPEFVWRNLSVTPLNGLAPLTINATAEVENIGGSEGECNATFLINGKVVDWKIVSVVVGEVKSVSFIHTFEWDGSYDVTIDSLSAKTVVVQMHDVKINKSLEGSCDGIRIEKNGTIVECYETLLANEVYHIKLQILNNGTFDDGVNVVVKVDDEVLYTDTKTLTAKTGVWNVDVVFDTSTWSSGDHIITATVSITGGVSDAHPEDNTATRDITISTIVVSVTCEDETHIRVSITNAHGSGFIYVGAKPQQYTYTFKHQGDGSYVLSTPFLQTNKTYYLKVCDEKGCGEVLEFKITKEESLMEEKFGKEYKELTEGGDVLNISKLGTIIPSIYTTLLTDMFWAMFFGGIFLAYWIRQEDVMLPSIVGMIGGVAMIGLLPPSAQHIAYILLVISIAGTLYTIIKARR